MDLDQVFNEIVSRIGNRNIQIDRNRKMFYIQNNEPGWILWNAIVTYNQLRLSGNISYSATVHNNPLDFQALQNQVAMISSMLQSWNINQKPSQTITCDPTSYTQSNHNQLVSLLTKTKEELNQKLALTLEQINKDSRNCGLLLEKIKEINLNLQQVGKEVHNINILDNPSLEVLKANQLRVIRLIESINPKIYYDDIIQRIEELRTKMPSQQILKDLLEYNFKNVLENQQTMLYEIRKERSENKNTLENIYNLLRKIGQQKQPNIRLDELQKLLKAISEMRRELERNSALMNTISQNPGCTNFTPQRLTHTLTEIENMCIDLQIHHTAHLET